jgi:hypothetical protein
MDLLIADPLIHHFRGYTGNLDLEYKFRLVTLN